MTAYGIIWKHTALCASYHTVMSVGLAMLTFGVLIPTESVI
jgi:hypothetical protein